MNTCIDSSARLKKSEVCAELGISPRTLDNLVLRNQFPPGVRIGKWCYWSRSVIERFHERAFNAQENWSPLEQSRR
jgi:predicted DNA-binding transcriptional regulator AlpA